MAITVSGLYCATFVDILDASQLAVDLVSDTVKCALFTNTITPNFTTDTAYGVSPYDANEVSGTGYTAGGAALGSKTVTASSGSLIFDAADTSWTSSTITSARGALIWDDTPASNPAVCLVNFGADYSTSNGTFAITWAAGGLFAIDLTP